MEKPTMGTSQLPTARRSKAVSTPQPKTAANVWAGSRHPLEQLVLERYRLHGRLGAGGFGTVWAAHDERLDREVAVKIVPRERVVGQRLEREAHAAARLTHPGIVTLYEAAMDDDGAYLVSELVDGSTLDKLLEAGRLSDRDIVEIAIGLCDALAFAHSQGVIHRDVKPSNILIPEHPVSRSYPAKLTDFGVARVIGGDSLTRTGDVVGTAAYMAPEQAEGLPAGASADLYALALVTYEALTGLNPVRTGTAAARARRLGAYLPPLRRQRRDLPRELGRAIDLALRPKPRERGTLEELRSALTASLGQVTDDPGVVTGSWSRATPAEFPEREPELARRPGPRSEPEQDAVQNPRAPTWPARALAATAAGTLAAWLTAHVLVGSGVAPALSGMLVGVAVIVLPRIGWLTAAAAIATGAALQHRPGGALFILLMAVVPAALLPLDGAVWPLAGGAPALGVLGLAGAWPALAARASSIWRRAVLGAVGWVWVVMASPLAGSDLYVRRPVGTPAPGLWTASLPQTIHDVVGPIVSSGMLAGAVVWALAAVILPWLLREGRIRATEIVIVTIWAAAVVSAAEVAIGRQVIGGATLGALASGALALSPKLPAAIRAGRHPRSSRTQLP